MTRIVEGPPPATLPLNDAKRTAEIFRRAAARAHAAARTWSSNPAALLEGTALADVVDETDVADVRRVLAEFDGLAITAQDVEPILIEAEQIALRGT